MLAFIIAGVAACTAVSAGIVAWRFPKSKKEKKEREEKFLDFHAVVLLTGRSAAGKDTLLRIAKGEGFK